jgi:adenylate cyclase
MLVAESLSHKSGGGSLQGETINAELAHIVASEAFSGSPRLQQLLTYVVTETIEGRAERIKGLSIAQDVFGQTDPEVARTSTIVSVEARRLRRKLADYYLGIGANAPIVIEIPKGTFVPVFRQAGSAETPEIFTVSPPQSTLLRMPGRFLSFALVILICLAVVLTWLRANQAALPPIAADAFERPVIAVIPFRNLTGDLENDGLVSGMAEDITADLAQLHEIDVISYSSVSLLTGPNMPPQEIGEALHVSHILQGSVRGTAPNVRVNAELLDARSGKLIWANRFDGNLGDPLELQDEIASKVVEGLPVGLSEWKNRSYNTPLSTGPETAALFDQAMSLANPPSDAARLKIAHLAFEAVIEADPAFAGGYAGVAYIGAFRALWAHVPDTQAEAALSAKMAERALDVDPSSPLALDALALSLLVMRNFDAAVRTSERALQLAPNDPYVQSYHAFILTADGQAAVAIPFAERAVRLDPLDPRTPFRNILGVVQLHAGNYELAIRSFSENDRMRGPQSVGHKANMAAAFAGFGNTREASRFAAMLPKGFSQGPWLDWHKRSFRLIEDALRIPALLQSAL